MYKGLEFCWSRAKSLTLLPPISPPPPLPPSCLFKFPWERHWDNVLMAEKVWFRACYDLFIAQLTSSGISVSMSRARQLWLVNRISFGNTWVTCRFQLLSIRRLGAWSKSQGVIKLTIALWLKAGRIVIKTFCQFSWRAIFLFDSIDD